MTKDITTISGAWHYVCGKGSPLNLAGKLLIGLPFFPYIVVVLWSWFLLSKLFFKKPISSVPQ
jgi:hypothetical protein